MNALPKIKELSKNKKSPVQRTGLFKLVSI